jgi:hypothetical protein
LNGKGSVQSQRRGAVLPHPALSTNRQPIRATQREQRLKAREQELREGSVRARANQYRLCWNEADPWSRGLQDGQHRRGPPEDEQSAAVGGHVLVMAEAREGEHPLEETNRLSRFSSLNASSG